MTKAVELAQVASTGVSEAFKNRIINGAMVIDQRNAGASVTGISGTYLVDRFVIQNNSGASRFSGQQNAGSVTPPAGFRNYLGLTSTSAYSLGATDVLGVNQFIEGFNIADLNWGTANAQTVTLSFWVRSSLTGTFGGSLSEGNAGTAFYPFSYSIPVANTWTQISVTIPGPTIGTWQTTNARGIQVLFSIGTGSTFSGTPGSWSASNFYSATGATSVVGTNGATFYITGVQLEVGSTATSFDYRPYGTELNLCSRYCQVFTDTSGGYVLGSATTTTSLRCPLQLQTMRASPTATYTTNTTFASGFRSCSSIATIAADAGVLLVGYVPTVAYTVADADYLQILSGGKITVSAEL